MLATLGAAIAPSIAILSYFYLKDKYETEPLHLVIKNFILGVLLVFPIMFIQRVVGEVLPYTVFAQSFILASFLEEFFKWIVIYYAAYRHVEFNEPYDGIVYATAVSLGFATIENFFYLSHHGLSIAIVRALLPVSSHGLFGVLMGYYFGKAKFSNQKPTHYYLLLSFFIPFLLHGTYDYIVQLSESTDWWIIAIFMLALWGVALNRSRAALRTSIAFSFGLHYDQKGAGKL